MEIHYIWIENFNNIQAKPVTLSSKYIFKTNLERIKDNEGNEYTRNGIINISYNRDYINNFFEKENVKNVSAIIGKNGTGKTSILKFIKHHFPEGLNADINNNLVVAYSTFQVQIEGGKEERKNFLVKPKNWSIKIETNISKDEKFEILDYDNSLSNINENFRFISKTSEATYFYYAFNLDYIIEYDNWQGIIDLSTQFQLCYAKEKQIELFEGNNNNNQLLLSYDLKYFIDEERIKSILFLISEYRVLLPFAPPEKLYFTFSKKHKYHFKQLENVKAQKIQEILSLLEKRNKDLSDNEILLNKFYIAIFGDFFVSTDKYFNLSSLDFNFDFKFDKKQSIKKFVVEFFEKLKNIRINTSSGKLSNSRNDRLSVIIPKLIDCIDDYFKKGIFALDKKSIEKENFEFSLNGNSVQHLKTFYEIYRQSIVFDGYLLPFWKGLSTGQQSFLSFASRFYNEKHNTIGSTSLGNLVIMIDEGDAGFHPDWQKKFFNSSLNFISKLFKDHKIQLIYTANTPYIVSDLPKSYITFIDNKDDEIIILDKNNDKEKTFGQNIHTLLSDGFFLEEGLIGDFANKKISDIIDFCNRLKNRDDKTDLAVLSKEYEEKHYRKIQKLIGEQYLREIIGNHLDEAEEILNIKNSDLEKELNKLANKYGVTNIKKNLNNL